MDTTETTHLSLCSGYGGIDLGLKRVIPNLRTVAYAEIEAFACENLLARMENGQLDAAPIWSDLKSFPWHQFSGLVDILTGGYPCQPFSAAGLRKGTDDPRHLWPYIAEGIRILKPTVCLFENVEGHITLGLSTVVSDLEEMGYKVSWGIFSAAEVGAPHQRKRVFIMAHRSGARLEGLWECGASQGRKAQAGHAGGRCDVWPSRPGEPQHAWEPPRVVGNAESSLSWIKAEREWRESAGGASEEVVANASIDGRQAGAVTKSGAGMGNAECLRWSAASGNDGAVANQKCQEEGAESKSGDTAQAVDSAGYRAEEPIQSLGNASLLDGSGQAGGQRQAQAGRADTARYDRQTESPLGRDSSRTASGLDYAKLCESCDNRTDELRLLGNGVVPATAALAFRTLLSELKIQN